MEHHRAGGGDGGHTHQPPNGARYVAVGIGPCCCRQKHSHAVVSHQTPNTQGTGTHRTTFTRRVILPSFCVRHSTVLCGATVAAFGQEQSLPKGKSSRSEQKSPAQRGSIALRPCLLPGWASSLTCSRPQFHNQCVGSSVKRVQWVLAAVIEYPKVTRSRISTLCNIKT